MVARKDALVTGGQDDPLLVHLLPLIAQASRIWVVSAFVKDSGLRLLEGSFQEALERGAQLRLVTGTYLGLTQEAALWRMLAWMEWGQGEPQGAGCALGCFEARVVEVAGVGAVPRTFHPKAWLLEGPEGGVAFVGSSNLSEAALLDGVEWNLRLDQRRDPDGFARVVEALELCWARAKPLDAAWVGQYHEHPADGLALAARDGEPSEGQPLLQQEAEVPNAPLAIPEPHAIQRAALGALSQARARGERRALVVLATGLGKTWMAAHDALAVAQTLGAAPKVLFVAHRRELLEQAGACFAACFPDEPLGFLEGGRAQLQARLLFASVQTLSRPRWLAWLRDQGFDYAVFDEAHHATAQSYRDILGALRAGFILGLTATPERRLWSDARELLGVDPLYRADLGVGIEAGLLCPFAYFGLKDPVDYASVPWRNGRFDPAELEHAVQTQARMQALWEAWQQPDKAGSRTLVFCVSVSHARFVAAWLQARGVRAEALYVGQGSTERGSALQRLEAGQLDALCTVDLFNEGVDCRPVDRVVMLRPTESSVLFLQQLGRGLRRAPRKPRLTVLDFVGNHRMFVERIQRLLGLSSREVALDAWLDRRFQGEPLPDLVLPQGCALSFDLEAIELLGRLARRPAKPDRSPGASRVEVRVVLQGAEPVLSLGELPERAALPVGETLVRLPDGALWTFRMGASACGLAWSSSGEAWNQLPALLRGWFGEEAGREPHGQLVRFLPSPDGWWVEPVVHERGEASARPARGALVSPGELAARLGLAEAPAPPWTRAEGRSFLMLEGEGLRQSLTAPDRCALRVPGVCGGEEAELLLWDSGAQAWRYAGVAVWFGADGEWRFEALSFQAWRALGHGRGASRTLEARWAAEAGRVVAALIAKPDVWAEHQGRRCRVLGGAGEGVRVDGGPGGFQARSVSLTDLAWALAAEHDVGLFGGALDEARVNKLRYLDGTPKGSTRWIDTGWALVLLHHHRAGQQE